MPSCFRHILQNVMDIRMPVMNGYKATEAIRNLQRTDAKDIPIIAMTADVFEESKREAMGCGMNDIITKPIDQEQILKIIKKYMRF